MSDGHVFRAHGACIWCGVSREKVQDRKAPPFCDSRPDETQQRPEPRNETTGY